MEQPQEKGSLRLTVFLLPGEEALLAGSRDGGYVCGSLSDHDRMSYFDKIGRVFSLFLRQQGR